MTANRKPVNFDPGLAKDNLISGGCSLIAGLGLLVLILPAEKRTVWDWLIVIGIPFFLIGFLLLGGILGLSEARAGMRQNRQWRQNTVVMDTRIIEREQIDVEADDYADGYSTYYLALQMVPDQQAACPGETVVRASVSQKTFQRYERKQTARIAYLPADPLVFLIEGEM